MKVEAFAGLAGCLTIILLFALAACIGPLCLAFDINHLVPLVAHKPVNVSPWDLPIFIGGIFLGEVALPVAIVTWILMLIGVVA